MRIRPSNIGIVLKCSQSISDGILVESDDAAARLGTAVHDWAADLVRGSDPASPRHYAASLHVDPDDCSMLCSLLAECWESLRDKFPNPQVEQTLDDFGELGIGGTLDVNSVVGNQLRVLDWKSGRKSSDHGDQMRAYGYIGLLAHPECDSVSATVVYVRDREAETLHFTRAELDRWYAGCVRRINNSKKVYRAGEHCAYCPRGADCPAKTALLKQAKEVSEQSPDTVSAMSDGDIVRSIISLKLLKAFTDGASSLLRGEVIARGGLIDCEEGKAEIRSEDHATVNPQRAWAILEQYLTPESLVECVKISKTGITDQIAKTAERGKKAAKIREVMDRLKNAGAIETRTVEKLFARGKPNKIDWIDDNDLSATIDAEIQSLTQELSQPSLTEFNNPTVWNPPTSEQNPFWENP